MYSGIEATFPRSYIRVFPKNNTPDDISDQKHEQTLADLVYLLKGSLNVFILCMLTLNCSNCTYSVFFLKQLLL